MGARRLLLSPLAAVTALLAVPASAGRGGPDTGGYSWRDSFEVGVSPDPTAFTGPTVDLFLTDGSVLPVTLPFPFSFYGLAGATTLWVSDDGWMALPGPPSPAPNNAGIPSAAAPNGLLAPFWDDLDPTGGFAVHGPIAGGGYAVLLRGFQKSGGAMVQLQLELFPTGGIRFVYIVSGDPATATVGIEDETGTRGTELVRDGTTAPGVRLGAPYAIQWLAPTRLSCASAVPVACGAPATLSTASGTSAVTAYPCAAGSWNGRELLVAVDLAQTSAVNAALTGLGGRQLGLFLLGSCHEDSCTTGGGTTVASPALRPGRHYLVVDGASAADDGGFTLTVGCTPPAIAVHTGWKTNPGEDLIAVSPPFTTRGDPAEFAYASFPSRGDPGWVATPDPNFASFDMPSTVCGRNCGEALQFTYYKTCLWLPASISELSIAAGHVDDGIAVQVNGTLVSTGQLGAYQTPNLAGHPALLLSSLNDIEVIHSDDCCARTVLRDLTFTVDGQTALAEYADNCDVTATAAPVPGSRCPGTAVVLDASASSSLTCADPLEYRWRIGSVPLGPFTTDPTLTDSPDVTTTYSVDVLCPSGCGCQATASVTVEVSPAIVHAVPATVSICAGGTAALGGSPTASGGTPPLVHSWTPTSGLDDPASPNPRATPAATTTYTLEVTDSIGCRIATTETVEVGGGLPASAGNSLLAGRSGADAAFRWAALADATSYNLKTDSVKEFTGPVVLLNVATAFALDTGAVTRTPALIFYRVHGVGCPGEGP